MYNIENEIFTMDMFSTNQDYIRYHMYWSEAAGPNIYHLKRKASPSIKCRLGEWKIIVQT